MKRLRLLLLLPLLVECRKLSSEENSLLQHQCGKPVPGAATMEKRSMHTPEVSRSEAPWVAGILETKKWFPNITIEQRGNDFLKDTVCSGSLISSRHIITAAHCVVVLKTTCTSDGRVESAEQERTNIARLTVGFTETFKKQKGHFKNERVEINQIFVSNRYTANCKGSETLPGGDLAVIELAEDVFFSDLLYPACLSDKTPALEDQLTIFGYGVDGVHNLINGLRQHNTTVVNCTETPNFDTVCTHHTIASECNGDSGGGYVVHDRRGAVYVAGVVSASRGACADKLKDQQQGPLELPLAFMPDVSKHLTWICAATGICVNKKVSDTVKLYEEKGLTKGWHRLLTPLTGTDIYI